MFAIISRSHNRARQKSADGTISIQLKDYANKTVTKTISP
jgi:hypothetical protein